MKRIIWTTVCLTMAILLTVSCTGCGSSEPNAMVLIAGNHANSKRIDIDLSRQIENAYLSQGNISIVLSDGQPHVLYDKTTTTKAGRLTEKKGDSKEYWKNKYVTPQVDETQAILESCMAEYPEVDTLKALQTAESELRAMASEIKMELYDEPTQEIILFDTGLCTTGQLSFLEEKLNSLLFCDVDILSNSMKRDELMAFMDELQEKMEIPNLNNVTVTWYGLGQVDTPQDELSKVQINNLQCIWTELLKRSGAIPRDGDYFIPTSPTIPISADPIVSVVTDLSSNNTAPPLSLTPQPPESVSPSTTPELSQIPLKIDTIFFVANMADPLSEEDAIEQLIPFADILAQHTGQKYLLVGTTSSMNGGDPVLAKARADTVKELMSEKLNVDETQLETIGLGYAPQTELCIIDRDSNNNLIESDAKQNRAVWLIPDNSEIALKIKDQISSS